MIIDLRLIHRGTQRVLTVSEVPFRMQRSGIEKSLLKIGIKCNKKRSLKAPFVLSSVFAATVILVLALLLLFFLPVGFRHVKAVGE